MGSIKTNVKKKLIEITSAMLSESTLEEMSIRKVAKEAGCTSGTIYLYFKNFNHLLLLACLKYLHDYVEEIKKIDIEFNNSLEEYLHIWEIFCKHAFKYPKIYYFIFFLSQEFYQENHLDEYYEIKEYYTIFLEEFSNFPTKYYKMILKLDLEKRNKIFIEKLAREKIISPSDMTILNLNHIFIFKGYLEKSKEATILSRERNMRSCLKSLKKILAAYRI
ncbi:MAG: TetR/AcrR family transcriptional regulator [Cetobacterium sp.]